MNIVESVIHSSSLPEGRGSPFDALHIPEFRLVFADGLLSSIGMTASNLVQSWLVLSLTGDSALWVGVSVALNGLGRVVFAIVGGVISDQLDRRMVVFAAQLTSAVTAGVLAVACYFQVATLPLVLATSFVFGATLTVDMTVTNALVYDVAGRQRLLNAMSLRRIATVPMMISGSLLMGLLLAEVGTWAAYAVVSLVLFLAPWVLLRLPPTRVSTAPRTSFLVLAAEGVRYGAMDWQIRTLLLISVGMEAFGFSYQTMVPVMAKDVLDIGAVGLGQISAASGVGAGLAMLSVAALGNVRNKPRLLFWCAMGAGVSLLAFSLSRHLALSMLCALLTTGMLMAYDIALSSLLQIVSPSRIRGRIVSLYGLAIGFMSFGGFAIGAIGSFIGVPLMLGLSSVAIFSNLLLHRHRLLQVREQPRG
ncbi:MAG TPA: MFS transporter [Chloroflexota bacterium]|nr:MFS transporter [Chloroflexota bacterium]